MVANRDLLGEARDDATGPAREVLEHLYQALLKIPGFTLRDGTQAKVDPFYPPEINDNGDLRCGLDILLDKGTHLEFTVENTGWGKSFVAAQTKLPPTSGRGR